MPVDQRGDAEHLAHPRAAFRPLVADHQYFARLVSALLHHLGAGFLRIENPRRAFEHQRLQPRDLDERAIGREVAFENHDPAAGRKRRTLDHLAVGARMVLQLFFQRPARERQAIAVQGTALEQRFQHGVNAACRVKVFREETPARLHVGEERRAPCHAREIIEREADAGLVRDRRNVQPGVGRAAGRGDRGAGVLQALLCHQLSGQRTVFQKIHHDLAGLAGKIVSFRRNGGQGRRAGKPKAERLRHHRHRVGGELSRARAQRRQADMLERPQVIFLHVSSEHRPDRLIGIEHGDIAPLPFPGQRGAAVDEHRRKIESHHRHHHAGQRLVAAGEGDERVVGMAARHRLDAVGDDFARQQRVAHAAVVHRHRVGDRDRREVERHAARAADGGAGFARELAEQRIARRHAPVGRGDADEGLAEIGIRQAERAQERAMGRAIEPLDRDARGQFCYSHVSQSF